MMEREMYFEYARAVNGKLREEVNGYVRYKVYPDIDAIIFTINFKDFDFEYAINNIQDKIYAGDSALMAEEIIRSYKGAIRNAFFKSEERKQKEVKRKLGITEAFV